MNKKQFIVLICLAALCIGFSFFWFEIRPAKIMHDCSWTKVHENEKSADSGITKEEADKNKQECLDGCALEASKICFCKYLDYSPKSPRLAEEARDWWRKSTDKEYDFCLHEKGLK